MNMHLRYCKMICQYINVYVNILGNVVYVSHPSSGGIAVLAGSLLSCLAEVRR